jgi:hypothetical protein
LRVSVAIKTIAVDVRDTAQWPTDVVAASLVVLAEKGLIPEIVDAGHQASSIYTHHARRTLTFSRAI